MSVTPAMIATALGQAVPTSGSTTESQWQMWIDDALMLIMARADSIDPTPTLDQARLDYVVREAVVAHVRNPDDASQVAVSVDDGSVSRSYRSSKGRITILDEWWELLGLASAGGGPYAVDTVSSDSTHVPWCSLAFDAAYCSCGADIAGFPLYEGGYY